jgi:hypothetical protein
LRKYLALALLVFLSACTTVQECTVKKDCVEAECCHPTGCVARENAPECGGVMCTMDCAPNTMDCGQGYCDCVEGKCVGVFK